MGVGPAYAIPKALERAKLQLKDMDIIEINEAFASQVLGCLKLMNVDFKDPRVNPNGGAIAIGHPLGCLGRAPRADRWRASCSSRRALRRGVAVHRRRPGPRRDPGAHAMKRESVKARFVWKTRCCSTSSSPTTSAWCASARQATARKARAARARGIPHGETDPEIFREMGELGILGPSFHRSTAGPA
jgi:hypothetical protein